MRRSVNPLRGKTTDRRAVCGKSACTVRREGGPNSIGPPYPYQATGNRSSLPASPPSSLSRLANGRIRPARGRRSPGSSSAAIPSPGIHVRGLRMRVLIVGENASLRMGGEATYPYFFFKLLREQGIEAWLVGHARVRDELRELLPGEFDRIHLLD